MRNNALAADIETMVSETTFPAPNENFDWFEDKLFVLIDCNYNEEIASTLRYDAINRCFFVSVEATDWLLVYNTGKTESARVKLKKSVRIDPHTQLAPQIDEIGRVQKTLEARLSFIGHLLADASDGLTMQEPSNEELAA